MQLHTHHVLLHTQTAADLLLVLSLLIISIKLCVCVCAFKYNLQTSQSSVLLLDFKLLNNNFSVCLMELLFDVLQKCNATKQKH